MTKYSKERGETSAIVTICLVVALVGALGWIFWQNVISKPADRNIGNTSENTEVSKVTEKPVSQPEATKLVYKEYGYDSCIYILEPSDVEKLDAAGVKLKKYLADNVATEFKNRLGDTDKWTFAVCSYYGDYAEGAFMVDGVKNSLIGPKDGTGDVELIDAYQAGGFSKSKLQTAKVPQELKRAWEYAVSE